MPLVRFGVKNEFKLGGEEAYKDAVQAEDPKPVLDGVAVAGLVGILRQLGDLAEFAAEVFHGLQEQVACTASRSRKLVTRIQNVEASLPKLEKAILSQTSHIHYAYTPGSRWHARIRQEQNHFIYDDLPPFVMDSYEECQGPPCLQSLERFDTGGPGSCLKRYSDPTFFRRASAGSELSNEEKSRHEQKARKIKQRRRSWKHNASSQIFAPKSKGSERIPSSSPIVQAPSSLSDTGSTFDTTFKSDILDAADSACSKADTDFIECVPSTSIQPDDAKNMELSSVSSEEMMNAHESIYLSGRNDASSPTMEKTVPHSLNGTWDEKMEIIEPVGLNHLANDLRYVPETKADFDGQELATADAECFDKVDYLLKQESPPKSILNDHYLKAAVDYAQDVPETNIDFIEQELRLVNANVNTGDDFSEHGSTTNSPVDEHYQRTAIEASFIEPSEQTRLDDEMDDIQYMLESFQPCELDLGPATMKCIVKVENISEAENTSDFSSDGSPQHDHLNRELESSEIQCDVGEGRLTVAVMENVCPVDALSEGENAVTVIEWNELDDMESETDHFVDALNTIDSESESEFEGQTQRELSLLPQSQGELVESATFEPIEEIISHQEPESDSYFVNNEKEQTLTDLETSNALVSSTNMESLVHAHSSFNEFAAENISNQEPELQYCNVSDGDSRQTPDDIQNAGALVSSTNMEFLGHVQSSCNLLPAEEKISDQEPEPEDYYVSDDHEEQHLDELETLSALVSSTNMESQKYAQSSCNESEAEQTNHQQLEQECHLVSVDHKEQDHESSYNATAVVPSPNMESLGHSQLSCIEGEIISPQEPECNFDAVSHDKNEQNSDDLMKSASSSMVESLGHAQSSCIVSKEAESNKLDHSECLADEQSVQDILSSSTPEKPQEIDDCANKPIASDVAVSGLLVPTIPDLYHGMSAGVYNPYPHAFWTNGSLLGLQPSKPIVVSPENTVNSDIINNYNVPVSQSNPDTVEKIERSTIFQASSLKDPANGNGSGESEVYKGNEYAKFANHVPSQLLDKKHEKSVDLDRSNIADDSMIQGLSNGHVLPHETKVSRTADVNNISAGACNTSEEKASLITLLGRELLKNGLRAGSSNHVDKSNTTYNDLENRSAAAILPPAPETIPKVESNSPIHSPPPSPPLEHMKISFRPIDGFENSRLKLKYPDGVDQHEEIVDTFPSFQLVPGPSDLKPDIGSDSDDDTFCRSYACMSDDYLVHLSDSNSDEWESGDTSGSNDHAFYDGFCRISSTEFTSSSPQCEEAVHRNIDVGSISAYAVHHEFGSSFDLPVLDIKNPFSYKETALGVHSAEAETSHFQQPTLETPPLPPVQWRVSNPLLNAEEDREEQRFDSPIQPFNSNLSVPSNKLNSDEVVRSKETAMTTRTDKLVARNSDPLNHDNQTIDGRKENDEGDFLHQIRTKSFSLRRTETTRSSHIPNNTTSNKVTAILQKANAIRQAVASDGDDDSWSDT